MEFILCSFDSPLSSSFILPSLLPSLCNQLSHSYTGLIGIGDQSETEIERRSLRLRHSVREDNIGSEGAVLAKG
jgi:hypothetical protein